MGRQPVKSSCTTQPAVKWVHRASEECSRSSLRPAQTFLGLNPRACSTTTFPPTNAVACDSQRRSALKGLRVSLVPTRCVGTPSFQTRRRDFAHQKAGPVQCSRAASQPRHAQFVARKVTQPTPLLTQQSEQTQSDAVAPTADQLAAATGLQQRMGTELTASAQRSQARWLDASAATSAVASKAGCTS